MIEYQQYAKIKNNYCLCYFGYSDEYLVQLKWLKPLLERQFPGLNICLGCKDDKIDLLEGCQPILTISKIKIDRHHFAHIREIRFNGQTHPIEELMSEAGVQAPIIDCIRPRTSDYCVMVTQGNYPTKPLEKAQIEQLKNTLLQEGYTIGLNTSIKNASLVVGVESVQLFEAAALGIRTILVPTGLGTQLYQRLFPKGEIWGGACLYKRN